MQKCCSVPTRAAPDLRDSPTEQHRDHRCNLSRRTASAETYQAGIRFDTGRYGKTDCHLRQERTCRSAGPSGTDQRKSHCHRETGRSDPARFHQGHPSVLTDHQVTGRIPPDRVIHRSTHCPAGQLPVFRHHLPPGGQPHAQHPGIRCFPRSGVLCLRTQELQRKDTFPGMPQGQPEHVQIDRPEEINKELLRQARSIGICGATSTPKWLMETCRKVIMED